jgi:hypothetical protein
MIGNVIGQLNASASIFRHDPHLKWRCAGRKAVPVHRKPVSFGEVKKHCRIAARGNDPPSRGLRLEPMLFEILQPHQALHAILSIKN